MKVLIVEDELVVAMVIEEGLFESGIRYDRASTADEAIGMLERDHTFTHVVTDVDMPGSIDGLKLSHVIRKRWPPVHLIVMSGRHRLAESDLPERAVFVPKPFLGPELHGLLRAFRD